VFLLRPAPRAPLFPYTTLFRSHARRVGSRASAPSRSSGRRVAPPRGPPSPAPFLRHRQPAAARRFPAPPLLPLPSRSRRAGRPRSEEHTSELQSRANLVCRLLL